MKFRGINLRRLGLALAVLVAIVPAIALIWPRTPPQIITLPNGEKYVFAGVTYGTNVVAPSLALRLIHPMPIRIRAWFLRQFNSRISTWGFLVPRTSPELMVWFRRLNIPATAPATNVLLVTKLLDSTGVEGGWGGPGLINTTLPTSVIWWPAEFTQTPRRSPMLRLNFYTVVDVVTNRRFLAQVTFRNPLYGRYPQWQPEPLPAVKSDGDLKVTLDTFETGIARSVRTNGAILTWHVPAPPGQDADTSFHLSFGSPRGTNETWMVAASELSDATGNVISNRRNGVVNQFRNRPPARGGQNNSGLNGTLWPDEAAWRLKVELVRVDGFPSNEVVTFKNVPVPTVGMTNNAPLTNYVGDIPVVLTRFARNPNIIGAGTGNLPDSQIRIELPGNPPGVMIDLLEMNTDDGPVRSSGFSSIPFGTVLHLRNIPTNATAADITWVVQKPRSVEFLVKPPGAK